MTTTTETVDIGPECFASADESVICWKGENYYRRPDGPEYYWRGYGSRWHIRSKEGMWTLCGNYANRERSKDPVLEADVCKSCLKALSSGREWS